MANVQPLAMRCEKELSYAAGLWLRLVQIKPHLFEYDNLGLGDGNTASWKEKKLIE